MADVEALFHRSLRCQHMAFTFAEQGKGEPDELPSVLLCFSLEVVSINSTEGFPDKSHHGVSPNCKGDEDDSGVLRCHFCHDKCPCFGKSAETQRELPEWVSKQVWGWGVKRVVGALGQSQVAHHVSNRLLKTLGLEFVIF